MRFTVALIAIATVAVTSLGSGGGTYEPAQSIKCTQTFSMCNGGFVTLTWWCTPPEDAPTPTCCGGGDGGDEPGACHFMIWPGCCGGTVVLQ